MRILVVEDQEKIANALKKGLEIEGFAVDILFTGTSGLQRILANSLHYDLFILDIMLPSMTGLEILERMRNEGITTPVLLLTALDGVDHKVTGLNTGADDYLAKPFAFAELIARVRALLRRPTQVVATTIQHGDLVLDTLSHRVTKGSREITLTTKEFAILEYFMRNPEQVLSREQIMNHVWDYNFDSFSNVVDVHIKNLRKKLQKKHENIFETVHGLGYRYHA